MGCFGNRVLFGKVLPNWLQILPYKVPDDIAGLKVTVMLFKVNFQQTTLQAFYHIALAQVAAGEREAAGKTLDRVIAEAPADPAPRLRRAELAFEASQWGEGLRHALEAAALLPTGEARQVRINAAGQLYRAGEHRLAVQVYREALAGAADAEMAAYLAWVLATSRDDGLRDGPEALRLVEAGGPAGQPASALTLSVRAAALAECGRFAEAVRDGEAALRQARETQDAATAEVLAKRLEVLRAGQPIRE
jgi:tetratricopeptide (TPR) repeat protein